MHPHVAAWRHACSQWDSAIATQEHEHREKRRKLCKEHVSPLTRAVNTNKELETAMVHIRQQLPDRIKNIHTQRLSQSKLDNYFTPQAAGDARPEIEELHIPDVATDVKSTYLRLHAKRHIYVDDEDFHIVKDALSELRGYVSKPRLRAMTKDPPKGRKTVRQYFNDKSARQLASIRPNDLMKRLVRRKEMLLVPYLSSHRHGGHTTSSFSFWRKRGDGFLPQSNCIP